MISRMDAKTPTEKLTGISLRSLSDRPDQDDKIIIQGHFWPQTSQDPERYFEYFEYYEAELRRLTLGISRQSWQLKTIAAKTHNDILHTVKILSEQMNSNRPSMRDSLRDSCYKGADDVSINRTIDFALRLWLMLNVRDPCFELDTPDTPIIQWDEKSSLESFVSRQFPPTKSPVYVRESRLDPCFTVVNMIRICGLKLEWSEHLEDHLRLDRLTKVLRIYPYKLCLSAHLETSEKAPLESQGYVVSPRMRPPRTDKLSQIPHPHKRPQRNHPLPKSTLPELRPANRRLPAPPRQDLSLRPSLRRSTRFEPSRIRPLARSALGTV